tara:strand:- start:127 stop:540 length:414 start_codon:yes stop_codon:yes gene_type:complete
LKHQVEIKYIDNLRTEATHIQSNNKIITDAPIDNMGKGEAFSPTDLFVSSLASCMMTIMGIAAKTHEINIGEVNAEVLKVMGANPRRVSEIHIRFIFNVKLANKEKEILERAAKHCPVGKSINKDIKEVILFSYENK